MSLIFVNHAVERTAAAFGAGNTPSSEREHRIEAQAAVFQDMLTITTN
jgi:hypothetical protein